MYIHISNLNRQVTKEDILYLLKAYSTVGKCIIHHVKNTKTRYPDTYALIDISDKIEMEKSVLLLNGTLLGGRKIVVQVGQ